VRSENATGPQARVTPDCHFAVQLNRLMPGFLSYSVAVFLKWQSDITLPQAAAGEVLAAAGEVLGRPLSAPSRGG
jgi:hypothetical protein